MNVANLKRILLVVGVIIVACLLASAIFKILQFIIVAAIIAVIAGILYAVVAPKIFKDKNKLS